MVEEKFYCEARRQDIELFDEAKGDINVADGRTYQLLWRGQKGVGT